MVVGDTEEPSRTYVMERFFFLNVVSGYTSFHIFTFFYLGNRKRRDIAWMARFVFLICVILGKTLSISFVLHLYGILFVYSVPHIVLGSYLF